MLVLAASGARAQTGQDNGLFTVRDVAIDQTAETASAARAVALREGQREALSRLVARLTGRSDRARLPAADPQTLESVVQSLQIENEKTSSVRYLADLTVTFRPEAVRAYLRSNAIPFAETRSRPLLVLPVLQRGEANVLWDEPNPWREAWGRLPLRAGLVPFVVPVGDLADLADVTVQQAIDGDREALSRIADRYGAGGVLVALAQLQGASGQGDEAEGAFLSVAATRVGEDSYPPVIEEFRGEPSEALPALMQRAAEAVAAAVESQWTAANLIRFDQTGTLRAAVPLGGLQDWVAVRERLADSAVVSHFRLVALTRDSADVEIVHLGSEEQLDEALAQKDLLLERTEITPPRLPFAFEPPAADRPSHVLRLRPR